MKSIKAKEFDRMFDEGEDVAQYLDANKAMSIEEFKAAMMKNIDTKEFDERFDNGDDISEYIDNESAIKFEKLLSQKQVILSIRRPQMKKLAKKSKNMT